MRAEINLLSLTNEENNMSMNMTRKRRLKRMEELKKEEQSEQKYITKLLNKIELSAEDCTDTEEGHWCLESFGDKPFDNYSADEDDYQILERFRRKYKLPRGWLNDLTREGLLDRHCIDDGTLHLYFNKTCRLGRLSTFWIH
tara:strand:- start:147 stop:572 length:426 start_codon:yes stop_codon:yes gene_type:complete